MSRRTQSTPAQEHLTRLVRKYINGEITQDHFWEQIHRKQFTKVNFRMLLYMNAQAAREKNANNSGQQTDQ